jgi:hypothetical protein
MKSFVKAVSAALVAASTLVPAVAFAQAAPPLTYLEAFAVCSEDDYAIYGDCESISASQGTTFSDHGGSWMYAVTVELGYGGNRFASLDNTAVSEITAWAEPIWSNGVLVGWYRYWDLSGYSDGSFFYQSQSLNTPYNTESDTLTIL